LIFAFLHTTLNELPAVSDSDQHQTTSLQCMQAVKRRVRVTSVWRNSASRIFFRRLRVKSYIG